MSEQDKETYVLYNMVISKIKMADSQYSDDTKEMCEVAIMSALFEAYQIQDVYYRVLQYMRDNEIYERYLRPILELSLYPPEADNQTKGDGENTDNDEYNSKEEKSNSDSNVKTKTNTYDKISKKFIEDMFRSDNDL